MLTMRNRLLCLFLLVVFFFRWLYDKWPTPYRACHNNTPILVGTHHKTGTVLLQHILKDACRLLRWRCTFNHRPTFCASPEDARKENLQLCFLQHGVRFKLKSGAPYRFIHGIRDPFEVVISGYQYHLRTTEKWAHVEDPRWNGTSYLKYLNSLPLREGLLAELKHSLRDSLKTMPRLWNRTHANPCTLEVRLGDFSRDYHGTVRRMWDLLGVTNSYLLRQLDARVARHDVYGMGRQAAYNRHVAKNTSVRDLMRSTLRDSGSGYRHLQRVRAVLGFPAVGLEGPLPVPLVQHRAPTG